MRADEARSDPAAGSVGTSEGGKGGKHGSEGGMAAVDDGGADKHGARVSHSAGHVRVIRESGRRRGAICCDHLLLAAMVSHDPLQLLAQKSEGAYSTGRGWQKGSARVSRVRRWWALGTMSTRMLQDTSRSGRPCNTANNTLPMRATVPRHTFRSGSSEFRAVGQGRVGGSKATVQMTRWL